MNGASRIISKYDDIASYEFNSMNPGPLSKINDYPNKNFYGGRYNTRVLQEDTIFYRGGKADEPLGQRFTSEPPTSVVNVRIDSAVRSILKQEN